MANEKAPPGTIFVCGACGKSARWRYGFSDATNQRDPEASPGWDSSCMTWATLCDESSVVRTPGGRVVKANVAGEIHKMKIEGKLTV